MHKHREERFKSMEVLASELENVFHDGRGLEEPVDEPVYESFSEPVQSSSSSSSLNLVVVAVVALLFVGFVGFFWFQSALDKPAEQEKTEPSWLFKNVHANSSLSIYLMKFPKMHPVLRGW